MENEQDFQDTPTEDVQDVLDMENEDDENGLDVSPISSDDAITIEIPKIRYMGDQIGVRTKNAHYYAYQSRLLRLMSESINTNPDIIDKEDTLNSLRNKVFRLEDELDELVQLDSEGIKSLISEYLNETKEKDGKVND